MNKTKLAYYIPTVLFSLLIVMGATMYFVQHDMVVEAFTKLGYPTYLIYPLAIAKLAGIVAIWTRISKTLTDMAYAGFIYDLILAAGAHIAIGDGEAAPAIIGLALVITSWAMRKHVVQPSTT